MVKNAIHIINKSDDKNLSIAVYQKKDRLPNPETPVWYLVSPNIDATARLLLTEGYSVFASYTAYDGRLIYETRCLGIIDLVGNFKIVRDGKDIQIEEAEDLTVNDYVTVKVEPKIGQLVNINIARGNSIYAIFPTSPGETQEIKLDNKLYIAKVHTEMKKGDIITAQSILAPPSEIIPGQTAYIEGNKDKGYTVKVVNGLFSGNCVSNYYL